MSLKPLIFAVSFAVIVGSSAVPTFAQAPATNGTTTQSAPMLTPEQRIDKRLAHARKTLGLTDAQVDQLRTILQQNAAKIASDRQNLQSLPPGPQKRDARKQLAQDMRGEGESLKGVLTPDQLKKWKKMKINQIERREKRLERRENRLKQ